MRIYTSLPFKDSYLGAPIIDEYEKVVGVICDSDSE